MADFSKALAFALPHEGGFVDNKADPGGATKFGISLYWLKHLGQLDHADLNHDGRVDVEDIKALTLDTAGEFYKRLWWDKYRYGEILIDNVASKLFDTSINVGGLQCHKIAQRSLCVCGYPCIADGILGPRTITILNLVDPIMFLSQFRAQQARFYISLVSRKPEFAQFKNGWLRRAAS